MVKARFEWQLQTQEHPEAVKQLVQDQQLSPVIADLLVKKGLTTAEAVHQYLTPDPAVIHDPLGLHDMQKAVDRLQEAIANGEQITVYGDYDADGITSTAVMYETLQGVGAKVNYYIPDRFKDGYGPNEAAYQRLIEGGTQLLLTVDNGVSGKKVIDPVVDQGIDVIITDHHELPAELPHALAIVHPRYPGTDYPFPDLSGVGVAFKLAWALTGDFPSELLDLVAIGEIADMVQVTDENRALIALGLQVLRQGMRPGLHELVKKAGLNESKLTDQDIGFGIAPRLNALGRVANASDGVELLTTLDEDQGQQLAQEVEDANQQRRQLVDEIVSQATSQAQDPANADQPVLVLLGHGWHQGVLGIVASRIKELTGKPTIVASVNEGDEVAKGSGRSSDDFDLFKALDLHRDLMTAFGGHPAACGLSFAPDQLESLKAALKDEADKQGFDWHKQAPLRLAAALTANDVDESLYNDLQKLAPFGPGNEEPVFEFAGIHPQGVKTMGQDNKHLKFFLPGKKQNIPVVAFNQGQLAPFLRGQGGQVNLAATVSINEWNGHRQVQLMLTDIEIEGPVILDERTGHLTAQHFAPAGEYVVFDDRLRQNIAPHVDAALSFAEAQKTDFAGQRVTVVDLPASLTKMKELFDNDSGTPAMVRLLLAPQGTSVYSAGMPTRADFAKVYQFLHRYSQLRWPAQQQKLANYLNLNQDRLNLVIQVFSGLGFVTINSGVLKLQPPKEKVVLTQTAPYQKLQARYEAEEKLIYSDITTTANWVLQCLKKN